MMADRARELMVLNAIAAAVAQSLEPQPLLISALDHVLDLLEFNAGAIYTRDDDGQLQMIVARGLTPPVQQHYARLPVHNPIVGQIVRERKTLVIEDVRTADGLKALATESDLSALVGLPLFARGEVAGVLAVLRSAVQAFSSREITLLEAIADHIALALDNARLFAAEQQRRQQAETLRIAAAAVGSTLDLPAVLETILAQLQRVVPYRSATVQLREEHNVRVIAARGFPEDLDQAQLNFPVREAPIRRVIDDAETVLLADAQAMFPAFHTAALRHVRSWMGVPLCYAGHTIGMITLDRAETNAFRAADAQLAGSFAQQAALAIENARLFAAEQHRRRQSEALRKGALALTEPLGPDAVLHRIVQQATELMETPMCAIYELDANSGELAIRNTWGDPRAALAWNKPIGEFIVKEAIGAHHAMSVPDVADAQWQQQVGLARLSADGQAFPFRSVLAAPLLVKGRVYGGIVVYYALQRSFHPDEIQLLDIFADQAALALEHARLFDQSRQLAALEERQRIARDLHDSVSQTLFSLTLAAQAARTTVETEGRAGAGLLATVQELASGALAEMRALIFELRPGALHEAGLAAAIERFVGAFRSRTGLAVQLELETSRLPAAVEEALYRITGEGLANIGKHAQATQATVAVHLMPNGVELVVSDNGVGFDPSQPITGDHMGQRTMQERAAALGGVCCVHSAAGTGTVVTVRIPLDGEKTSN